RLECPIAITQRDVDHGEAHQRAVLSRLVSLNDFPRFILLTSMRIGDAQNYLQTLVLITQSHRFLVRGNAFAILPYPHVTLAEAFVSARTTLVLFNDLLLKFECFIVLAKDGKHQAPKLISRSRKRIELMCASKLRYRFHASSMNSVENTIEPMRPHQIRIQLQ